ncbi:MAG: DMT family transporter [Pikeienuella sp.]
MNTTALYILTVLIWGASWIGISFQVGEVEPVHGVLYRYILAAALLHLFLITRQADVRLTLMQHGLCAAMGLLMFGANYVMVYTAISLGLTTGLAAVIFSLLIVMNAINTAVFYGEAPGRALIPAAVLGLAGVGMLFSDDLALIASGQAGGIPLLLCVGAVFGASLGNMLSRRLQTTGAPVTVANAWAMAYAAVGLMGWSLMFEQPFTWSFKPSYLISLGVLTVFSTIIAFWCYLTLLGRIGAARAAYAFVAFPAVALLISSVLEGFEWTLPRMIGVGLVLLGNIALLRGQSSKAHKSA